MTIMLISIGTMKNYRDPSQFSTATDVCGVYRISISRHLGSAETRSSRQGHRRLSLGEVQKVAACRRQPWKQKTLPLLVSVRGTKLLGGLVHCPDKRLRASAHRTGSFFFERGATTIAHRVTRTPRTLDQQCIIGSPSTLHIHPKNVVLSSISFLSYGIPTFLGAPTVAVALFCPR